MNAPFNALVHILAEVDRNIAEVFAARHVEQPQPSQTLAQLKASVLVDAMESFAREVGLEYGCTLGDLQDCRDRMPLVREVLTELSNHITDNIGGGSVVRALFEQITAQIDWDLRERIAEKQFGDD